MGWCVRGVICAAVVACGALWCGSTAAQGTERRVPGLAAAERFDRWSLYYAGDSYQGLPLTEVIKMKNPSGNPAWSFLYGDCTPPPYEGGCGLPVEIQNWTICDRFPAMYYVIPEVFRFRGARAARPETSGGMDVYTRKTTTAIFTGGEYDVEGVAREIRKLGDTGPGRLRPPVPGALKGKRPCQKRWQNQVDGPHGDDPFDPPF